MIIKIIIAKNTFNDFLNIKINIVLTNMFKITAKLTFGNLIIKL